MGDIIYNSATQLSRADVAKMLKARDATYSLDQAFYNDAALFQIDMEEIFYKEWLFAGLSCEIPERGNFFTLEIGRNPIVVVRDQHGDVRAFHNVCRHRGSKVCLEHRGEAAKLVCSYHQWTYELDGTLIYAGTEMGNDFDMAQFGLKEVALKTGGSYIFISLAEQPPEIDGFLADLATYLEPHDLANTKVAVESSIIEKANWKLVLENNRECYHCDGSHPELLNSMVEWDDSTDPRAPQEFIERSARMAAEWERDGIPHAYVGHGDRNRIDRIPLKDGAVSMTLDGKQACHKLMGRIRNPDLGSMHYLHLPNSWNHALGDHVLAFRVLPLGPEETLVTTKWLVHKNAVEGVDYHPDKLRQVWDATNSQDRELAENNQAGINSLAYQPGPYSRTYEFGIINFLTWYTDTLLTNIGGGEPAALQSVP